MKWQDKIAASLISTKDVLVGTFNKVAGVFGYEFSPGAAAKLVDETTDALEVPLAALIAKAFPLLPPAIAQGAARHALDYVDAAVAGMLAAKGK